jgi:hypothetical protein
MLKISLILVHIGIWFVIWQSCMYCKEYGNYCGCKEYSPTSLANYSSLWPWAATLPPLSYQWLIGGFPVTWSIDLVVDSDHMTHLYNSYLVVDITPPPLPSHMTRWLIGHMTYWYSGRRSHDFFSTLLVTWLYDSSVNFRWFVSHMTNPGYPPWVYKLPESSVDSQCPDRRSTSGLFYSSLSNKPQRK